MILSGSKRVTGTSVELSTNSKAISAVSTVGGAPARSQDTYQTSVYSLIGKHKGIHSAGRVGRIQYVYTDWPTNAVEAWIRNNFPEMEVEVRFLSRPSNNGRKIRSNPSIGTQ